jgi:hypothetical protein
MFDSWSTLQNQQVLRLSVTLQLLKVCRTAFVDQATKNRCPETCLFCSTGASSRRSIWLFSCCGSRPVGRGSRFAFERLILPPTAILSRPSVKLVFALALLLRALPPAGDCQTSCFLDNEAEFYCLSLCLSRAFFILVENCPIVLFWAHCFPADWNSTITISPVKTLYDRIFHRFWQSALLLPGHWMDLCFASAKKDRLPLWLKAPLSEIGEGAPILERGRG